MPEEVCIMPAGAPVPEGADAVVQIENTEQLPDRPDGEKRIKIVKVRFAMCSQSMQNTSCSGQRCQATLTALQSWLAIGTCHQSDGSAACSMSAKTICSVNSPEALEPCHVSQIVADCVLCLQSDIEQTVLLSVGGIQVRRRHKAGRVRHQGGPDCVASRRPARRR